MPSRCSPRVIALIPVAAALLASAALATTSDGHRIAFVTSTEGLGNLGDTDDADHWVETHGTGLTGLEAADRICQTRAEAAGLAVAGLPVFRAWISDALDDAWCRVQGLTGQRDDPSPCDGGTLTGAGPWVQVNGVPWAPELVELTDTVTGGPWTVVSVDETGAVQPDEAYLTGTSQDGTAMSSQTCEDWTSGAGDVGRSGARTSVMNNWSGGASAHCAGLSRILCLEEGPGATPRLPSAPGSLVFRTSEVGSGDLASWTHSGSLGGLPGADAACQALAAAAHLPTPESFVAWLSDATTNGADRLTTDGPFRRVDGFVVAETKADLLDGYLRAPISVTEAGEKELTQIWTGTTYTGVKEPTTCANWASEAVTGSKGSADRTRDWWTDFNAAESCSEDRGIYCFSNVVTVFWDGFEAGDTARWTSTTPAP